MRGEQYSDLDDVIADLEDQYGVDLNNSDDGDYLDRMDEFGDMSKAGGFDDDLNEFADEDDLDDFDNKEESDIQ